jgi:alkylated DNA repair protein (DNA oxidative demethylase)
MSRRQPDLFGPALEVEQRAQRLDEGAYLLRGLAQENAASLVNALPPIVRESPLRKMVTPGGYNMSVSMTNCGAVGWVTDRRGYRYDPNDPVTGRHWPRMPVEFAMLAALAAERAGFTDFTPDACLVNRYEPGARMSLHQDKDERDFRAPIVSVSLGLPAVFLFGGQQRSVRPIRVPLEHGDVVVWGGPARLRYHGVMPLKAGDHPLLGPCRINLTFRKAL